MNKYVYGSILALASIVFCSLLVRFSQTGPLATGSYRLLFAIPLLMLLPQPKTQIFPSLNYGPALIAVAAGIFFACDLAFFNLALFKTTLAEANLLTNLVPFMLAPVAVLLFKEKLPLTFSLTVIGASSGIYLLIGNNLDWNDEHLQGDSLALASAFFYALFFICIKKSREHLAASQVMLLACISGSGWLMLLAYWRDERLFPTTTHGWLILILIAVCGQVLGQTGIAHCIKHLPLQLASLLLLTAPIFAAIYGLIFFNEQLSLVQIIGTLIILISVYYAKKLLKCS